HEKYQFKIKDDINSNSGYAAHFDGTTEKMSGVINFVVMDSLTGHILISEMIETESYKNVTSLFRKVKFRYRNPLATISDLKPGFLSASRDSFDKVPHKFCDFHFLKTFKELLSKYHSFIKKRLCSTWKVKSKLQKQLKSIDKPTGKRIKYKTIKDIEKYWQDNKNVSETYRLTLQWILAFKLASSGKGLPFDLPYLDFYERLIRGKKFIDTINTKNDISIKKHYRKLDALIAEINNGAKWSSQFKKSVRMLKFAKKWLTKLRGLLFLGYIQDKKDPSAPLSKKYQITEDEAKAIPQNIDKYLKETDAAIKLCKNPDKMEILTKFRDQTKKYKDNLKIPLITVSVAGVAKTIVPSRTNNCLESFFRLVKSSLRRNTGRSALTKEFSSVGALLPYYISMRNHKTFKTIFENEDKLIEEFAAINKDKQDMPCNRVNIDRKLSDNSKIFHENLVATG
ncbi:MAG: transposase, partial [Desulfobacteraceae bacterium]|nr:transposase [Desulfobacteraceae bacterium]